MLAPTFFKNHKSSSLLFSAMAVLLGCGLLLSHPQQAQAERGSSSRGISSKYIIPPPLKDLGKDCKVRLVYFVPSDREVRPNFEAKADVLMRVVADVYRRELKANGIKTRGLDFEFNEDGTVKIHLVKGRHPSIAYTGEPFNVDHLLNTQQQEVWEVTGYSRHRPTLCFSEAGAVAESRPIPHIYSGFACVSGNIFKDDVTATTIEGQIKNFMDTTLVAQGEGKDPRPRNRESQTSNGVLAHELGHIFGMLHDTRDPRNIMMRGYDSLGKMYAKKTARDRPVRFSLAHARMAGATRFFSEDFDASDTTAPVIEKFELASAAKGGEKSVQFSIKIRDDKGIGAYVVFQRGGGQIDAMVSDADGEGASVFDKTVTFTAPRPLLAGQPLIYIINVLDVNGNLSQQSVQSYVGQ